MAHYYCACAISLFPVSVIMCPNLEPDLNALKFRNAPPNVQRESPSAIQDPPAPSFVQKNFLLMENISQIRLILQITSDCTSFYDAPLQVNSYQGITLSPVLSKIFEIVLLQRLSPLLQDSGSPHILQTAYQRGVSCMDAIFASQETLLTHHREGF